MLLCPIIEILQNQSHQIISSKVFKQQNDHAIIAIEHAGKGLTSWLSFVVSVVSLSLSHWYPGSGVVLGCIDS